MKLTSFAIIFIIIISPFMLISQIRMRMMKEDRKLRAYYDQVLDNAVQDAAHQISRYRGETIEGSGTTMHGARELAMSVLLDSLYCSFNVYGNPTGMAKIKGRVPVIIFLEADGYVPYALDEYEGPGGYRIVDYCRYPKRAYSGSGASGRYVIRYTLTDDVSVYDVQSGEERRGSYADFSDIISNFSSREGFELERLAAVSRAIEKDLGFFTGQFNEISGKIGVTYTFRFPRIDDADWIRALTDEGILVFAQGFPVITGGVYECNAFGGARVLRRPDIVGYEYQGRKVYCRDACDSFHSAMQDPLFDQIGINYYTDAREAASNGYYPCGECRP